MSKEKNEFDILYDEILSDNIVFMNRVKSLLDTLIIDSELHIHSLSARVKAKKSFVEKCYKKSYKDPNKEMTDMVGVRIITYTASDVEKVCNIVRQNFFIDDANSVDKSKALGIDKVGYQSVHYIAGITEERKHLAEYKKYKDFKFEIQIRTLLQHSWAEISHDKSYKFSGKLPTEIERRFYLISGVLELMDREFQAISHEIDEYSRYVNNKTSLNEYNLPVDSTTIAQFILKKFPQVKCKKDVVPSECVQELTDMGINTLDELNKILSKSIYNALVEKYSQDAQTTILGVIRDIMILHDSEKYFSTAWKNNWTVLGKKDFDFLMKFGINTSKEKIFNEYGIKIFN